MDRRRKALGGRGAAVTLANPVAVHLSPQPPYQQAAIGLPMPLPLSLAPNSAPKPTLHPGPHLRLPRPLLLPAAALTSSWVWVVVVSPATTFPTRHTNQWLSGTPHSTQSKSQPATSGHGSMHNPTMDRPYPHRGGLGFSRHWARACPPHFRVAQRPTAAPLTPSPSAAPEVPPAPKGGSGPIRG